jgi:hypothetical protein
MKIKIQTTIFIKTGIIIFEKNPDNNIYFYFNKTPGRKFESRHYKIVPRGTLNF